MMFTRSSSQVCLSVPQTAPCSGHIEPMAGHEANFLYVASRQMLLANTAVLSDQLVLTPTVVEAL